MLAPQAWSGLPGDPVPMVGKASGPLARPIKDAVPARVGRCSLMGWRDNRRRSICRKIMFTPEEWEQARKVHERWARNIPVYRRWGDFARQTLMRGASMNVSVTLASDPEAFKAELHRIGVNVNQIARIANSTGSVSPRQMRELHDLLASIDEKMTGMEREKAEIDTVQGLY